MQVLALLLGLLAFGNEVRAGECSGAVNGACADLGAVIQVTPSKVGPAAPVKSDPLQVAKGQITFDAEGNDNPESRYFSRRLHWPGGASGVTIGRGYDMKFRTRAEVEADLLAAGVPAADAETLSRGAGLKGSKARKFARANRGITITREAQKALFEAVYAEYEEMTRGLVCGWAGQKDAACGTFWSGLDPAIQITLVDLRYRGDLTRRRWNKQLKPSVTGNSLSDFTEVLSSKRGWRSVPADRFNRRVQFLKKALKAKPAPPVDWT